MSTPTRSDPQAPPGGLGERTDRWLIAAFRIGVAFLWLENSGWKKPGDFSSLRHFTEFAVEYPVVPPFTWIVENLVLPNFAFFGWMTLLLEASLGAFLLLGLAVRLWAVIGLVQTVAITMSVLNAPHEWEWAYYLMFLAHIALFSTAAGRSFGLDAVFRPRWATSDDRLSKLLMRLS